ncbi:MAG: hypothetical protein ABIH89_01100 [Elusimicrobiota bacterium]
MLFASGCDVYKNQPGILRAGKVYLIESAGAFTGGLTTGLLFLVYLSSFQVFLILSLLNLSAAFFLDPGSRSRVRSLSAILFITCIIIFPFTDSIDKKLIEKNYPGTELVLTKNTYYQNLMVLKNEDSYSIYTSGTYNFTVPDPPSEEMNAHIPMCQHEDPRRVLLIGSGMSGISGEILKHPVEEVIYIELDPQLPFYLHNILPPVKDKRFNTVYTDARSWLKRDRGGFDLIIMNFPPPRTLLLNRFYTYEFFSDVRRNLKPGGVFSFSLPSQQNYISDEQREIFASLKKTLEEIFAEVLITPGETAYFLAAAEHSTLTYDWRIMMSRLNDRGIKTEYFREYYLQSDWAEIRFKELSDRISGCLNSSINRDFKPLLHYSNMILWTTHFSDKRVLFFRTIKPYHIYTGLAILCLIMLYPVYSRKDAFLFRLFALTACGGFSEISFQLITIFIFQIFFGTVYWKMSIIFTSFMCGLIAGSFIINRYIENGTADKNWLIISQSGMVFYTLILYIFAVKAGTLGSGEYIFMLLPFLPGLIGGIQFPLICAIDFKNSYPNTGTRAGIFYGMDLLGSFAGALLISLIIVPVAGILHSIIIVFIVAVSGLLLLSGR